MGALTLVAPAALVEVWEAVEGRGTNRDQPKARLLIARYWKEPTNTISLSAATRPWVSFNTGAVV